MLTDRQRARIDAVFTIDEHVEVEVTWAVYQCVVAAYRRPDRGAGGRDLQAVIDSLRRGVPEPLTELRKLGRTLHRRADDVLAYFDLPGTSNGPTEAICESGFGFRNLTHYIARSLLEAGGFGPRLHPGLR